MLTSKKNYSEGQEINRGGGGKNKNRGAMPPMPPLATRLNILQAYMPLPRHIRNRVLIRRNIASDLCLAANNFAKIRETAKENYV